jgi:hypothetical protein
MFRPTPLPSASQIVDGLRKGGDAEFEFVVRAKARPVLLLSGRSDPRTGDLFALRLLRLEKLSSQLLVAQIRELQHRRKAR